MTHLDQPTSVEEVKNLLKQHDLKVTPARIGLVQYLSKTIKPESIDQLAKQLSPIGMDKATLYRNLVLLQQKGLVRQVDLHRDHAYYEWNTHSDHHHLVCLKCGRIEDFTGCDFDHLAATALKQTKEFSRILEHSFELFGLCNMCDRKRKI